MSISDRILKTIKKIAIDRNIPEDDVTYNQIAVEQAIELNKLNIMKDFKIALLYAVSVSITLVVSWFTISILIIILS